MAEQWTHLTWIGWAGWTLLVGELKRDPSSNTGLSMEYGGGGDFDFFMFVNLRIRLTLPRSFFSLTCPGITKLKKLTWKSLKWINTPKVTGNILHLLRWCFLGSSRRCGRWGGDRRVGWNRPMGRRLRAVLTSCLRGGRCWKHHMRKVS